MEAFFRQIFTTPMGFELASASRNITCYLSSGMTDGKPRLRATQSTHEVFSRDEKVLAGSNRSFGVVMATALAVVTLLNVWHSGRLWPWTSGLAALLLALLAYRGMAATAYVSDELVLGVYADQNSQGQRLAIGAQVQARERIETTRRAIEIRIRPAVHSGARQRE